MLKKRLYHYQITAYQIATGLKTRPDDWISEFKRRPYLWDVPVRKELQEMLMEEGVFQDVPTAHGARFLPGHP